ncbi:hypothetical protein PRVXH_000992 [Proteinivorax hydrogeniformans]|uniref:Uncharacterized protein n=1 Tax=Proteinivorax hydrogeniformans TaxID=1826727 RepID=A0AAU8HW97_9FIRM
MTKNNNNLIYSAIVLAILCVIGIYLFTEEDVQSEQTEKPQFYEVHQDNHVRVSLGYEASTHVIENGNGFIGKINNSTSDIVIIVENLRTDGLIVVPTPTVKILDSQNKTIEKLSPSVKVAGIANSLDTTYVSIENPIPPSNVSSGRYTFSVQLPYNYIFYDRVDHEEFVNLEVNYDIVAEGVTIARVRRFARLALPFVCGAVLVMILSQTKKRRF